MSENNQDNWLEDLLDTAEPKIEDAGFSARVMGALPRRPMNGALRYAVILGITALASFLVLFMLPSGKVLTDVITRAFQTNFQLLSIPLMMVVGLIAWGMIALATVED